MERKSEYGLEHGGLEKNSWNCRLLCLGKAVVCYEPCYSLCTSFCSLVCNVPNPDSFSRMQQSRVSLHPIFSQAYEITCKWLLASVRLRKGQAQRTKSAAQNGKLCALPGLFFQDAGSSLQVSLVLLCVVSATQHFGWWPHYVIWWCSACNNHKVHYAVGTCILPP